MWRIYSNPDPHGALGQERNASKTKYNLYLWSYDMVLGPVEI
jgi:hypothetical protein